MTETNNVYDPSRIPGNRRLLWGELGSVVRLTVERMLAARFAIENEPKRDTPRLERSDRGGTL